MSEMAALIEPHIPALRRYAFALLKAADYAKALGIRKIYALEFGVAAGAGLVNLAWLGLGGAPAWAGLLASLIYAAAVFRWV